MSTYLVVYRNPWPFLPMPTPAVVDQDNQGAPYRSCLCAASQSLQFLARRHVSRHALHARASPSADPRRPPRLSATPSRHVSRIRSSAECRGRRQPDSLEPTSAQGRKRKKKHSPTMSLLYGLSNPCALSVPHPTMLPCREVSSPPACPIAICGVRARLAAARTTATAALSGPAPAASPLFPAARGKNPEAGGAVGRAASQGLGPSAAAADSPRVNRVSPFGGLHPPGVRQKITVAGRALTGPRQEFNGRGPSGPLAAA